MTRVLMIRHGQSEWNAVGRWQGQADPPLSPEGRRQAEAAAAVLAGGAFARDLRLVATSDLARARSTAVCIADRLGLEPVQIEEGLRERDVGEWSGLTRAKIHEQWPGYLVETDEASTEQRAEVRRPPGWEPDGSVLARSLDALHNVAAQLGPDDAALVVCHGGIVMNIERHLGVDAGRLPNLGGRWVDLDGGSPTLGERVVLIQPEEAAAGRTGG